MPLDLIRHSRKWTQFPANLEIRNRDDLNLGDLFSIKRGLATGKNSFFILNESQVKEWEIPAQFLKPILPGPRNVTQTVVEALPNGEPDLPHRRYLLDSRESEEFIKIRWPHVGDA